MYSCTLSKRVHTHVHCKYIYFQNATVLYSIIVQFYHLFKKQLETKEWEKSLPPPPKAGGVSDTMILNNPHQY